MYDNGLLRQYFNQRHRDGYFKIYKKNFKIDAADDLTFSPIFILSQGDKCFYLKDCGNKLSADAEVLLSQVYLKAGLVSAIYLPVQGAMIEVSRDMYGSKPTKIVYSKNGFSVISNEINDEYSSNLDEFTFELSQAYHAAEFFPERKNGSIFNFKDYFTKDGARDFIKMHLFDVATRNYDRSTDNFFIDVDCENKISGVRLLDFSASSWPECDYKFQNYLGSSIESKRYPEMLKQLKDNETVLEVMSPDEMAMEVENLDFKGAARDIEDTIGYKIDSDFVKRMEDKAGQLAYDLTAPEQ